MKSLNKTLELTKELIKIPSVTSDKPELFNVLNFIKNYLQGLDLHFYEFESNGFPSLLVSIQDTKDFDVLLYSHVDVVPPSEDDQFTAYEKDNWLYGRGSGDMKSAAAVVIETLAHFANQKDKKNVGLLLTTDEEIGGMNGCRYVIEETRLTAKVAIIPDSAKGTDTIIVNQKGIFHIKIWQDGISSHASRPHLGENAIDKLYQVIQKIKDKYDLRNETWSSTVNIGILTGGEQVNQVPAFAEAKIDIRFTKPEQKQEIIDFVTEVSQGKVEFLVSAVPFDVDPENPYIKKYCECVNREVSFEYETGGSDARFFSEVNIPSIVTGIDKKNSHGKLECCDIDQIIEFQEILIQYIQKNF
jgi:succinyl-diaminopimelate desuccinylase